MRVVVRGACSAVFAMSALVPAIAATKATPPLRIQPASSAPALMTRDELRDCMTRNDDLTRRNEAMPARIEALNAEAKALEDTDKQLKAIQSRLSNRAERIVEDYNQATQDYNLRLGALKAGQKDFDRDARQLDADEAAFNAACTGRQYLQADHDALTKERAAAAAPAASH